MTFKLIMLAVAIWLLLAGGLAVLWALFFNWIRGAESIVFGYPTTDGLDHGACDRCDLGRWPRSDGVDDLLGLARVHRGMDGPGPGRADRDRSLAGGGDNPDPEIDNKDI